MGNSGLVGAFVACSNIPGVFIALVLPAFLGRISKRNLCLFGAALMLLAQIIFILNPACSVSVLLLTALIRGIGFGLMTSLFGFYLTAFGYNGALSVQSASTIHAIDSFFCFGPSWQSASCSCAYSGDWIRKCRRIIYQTDCAALFVTMILSAWGLYCS